MKPLPFLLLTVAFSLCPVFPLLPQSRPPSPAASPAPAELPETPASNPPSPTATDASPSPSVQTLTEAPQPPLPLTGDDLNLIYKGEHHLTLNLGMAVPMYMHFYNHPALGKNGVVLSSEHYDPPVGLEGSFLYRYFFDKGFSVGAELGGAFLKTTQNSQTLVTLGADFAYTLRRWPVDLPFSFTLGAHFNSLQQEYPAQNLQSGGIFFKPSFGVLYNLNENWALGATTSFWIVPEIYLTDTLKNESCFAHFWQFAVTVRYRFNE